MKVFVYSILCFILIIFCNVNLSAHASNHKSQILIVEPCNLNYNNSIVLTEVNTQFIEGRDTSLNAGEIYTISLSNDSVLTYSWFRNNTIIIDAELSFYKVQDEGSYYASIIDTSGITYYTDTIYIQYNYIPAPIDSAEETAVYDLPEAIKNTYFSYFFSDSRASFQIKPSVTTIKKLYEELKYFNFNIQDYPNAYNNIRIDSGFYYNPEIFYLKGKLNNKTLLSYALVKKRSIQSKTAFLLIPDITNDLASDMYANQTSAPISILNQKGNIYTYVKPNNDFRCIYSGQRKLASVPLFSDNTNNGRSYSATWLFEAMELVKYLKSIYENVIIVGQGQGGYAALLLSVESKPNACIITDGYSVLMENPSELTSDDFMIPYSIGYTNKEYLKNKMDSFTSVKFLFQYNIQDNHLFIKEDATNHQTETFFGVGVNRTYNYLNIQNGEWDESSLIQFISSITD